MAVLERYSRTAIGLHWLIAAMMIANVALAWSVDHLPDDRVRPVIDTHKSIGIAVLGLALVRVLWRATHPAPALPAAYSRFERTASHAAHIGLYLLIFALPLSGWLHDSAWKDAATHPMRLFGLAPWPRISAIADLDPVLKEELHTLFFRFHATFAYILMALLGLHVAGALKHQFLDREPELQRMWPARREKSR